MTYYEVKDTFGMYVACGYFANSNDAKHYALASRAKELQYQIENPEAQFYPVEPIKFSDLRSVKIVY